MALQRVAVTAAATLTHTFEVDETPTASTTAVAVSVVDANGSTVATGTATPGDPGVYTFVLPGQPALQLLTVSWSATIAGAAVVETDTVEVAGAFYFTLSQARNSDPALGDVGKYSTAVMIGARLETEQECEMICGRAFVPRYRRVVLDGSGAPEMMLPDPDVRSIRAARVAPRFGQSYVALSSAQLGVLDVTPDRIMRRTDGTIWTEGQSNVIVEYEFGLDCPPRPLQEASLVRLKTLANKHRSTVAARAQAFTSVDGEPYPRAMPGRFSTGEPDVDAVYARYSRGAGNNTAGNTAITLPASRALQFDPEYLSLFHGGIR